MRRWLVVLLILAVSGWMLFDGTRAILLGDYVTPASGEYAGQLGPWAMVVQAVGLDPYSDLVKLTFVLYGVFGVAAAVAYAVRMPWARRALLAMSILGLWYLPFGTVAGVLVFILLQFEGRQSAT